VRCGEKKRGQPKFVAPWALQPGKKGAERDRNIAKYRGKKRRAPFRVPKAQDNSNNRLFLLKKVLTQAVLNNVGGKKRQKKLAKRTKTKVNRAEDKNFYKKAICPANPNRGKSTRNRGDSEEGSKETRQPIKKEKNGVP